MVIKFYNSLRESQWEEVRGFFSQILVILGALSAVVVILEALEAIGDETVYLQRNINETLYDVSLVDLRTSVTVEVIEGKVSDIRDVTVSINSLIQQFNVTNAVYFDSFDNKLTVLEEKLTAIENYQKQIWEKFESFDLRLKVLAIIDETEFAITAATLAGGELLLDLCEYDPLGIGPINCDGLEFAGLEIPVATLSSEATRLNKLKGVTNCDCL